jgi:aflatoxin B1 aldehyde reductase
MGNLPSTPEVAFGCSSFSDVPTLQASFTNLHDANAVLDRFRSKDIKYLDNARGYPLGASGGSKRLLGTLGVGHMAFIVDTKMVSWAPGSHTAGKVSKSIDVSLEALKMSKVHVIYLHSQDWATPVENKWRALEKAYREGKFEKVGLSN